MEACASAHHWARAIAGLGHAVLLIPPAYVKPFVKRQQNDMADAEAIAEAATRPTMRFVAVKSEAQQAAAMAYRTRELLVRQRTQTVNALRGHLAEYGVIAPTGIAHVSRLAAAIENDKSTLPAAVVTLARMLLAQVAGLSAQIDALEKEVRQRAERDETARRLMKIPGVGAIVATALTTFAPPPRHSPKAVTSPPGRASRRASIRAAARGGRARSRRRASATSVVCSSSGRSAQCDGRCAKARPRARGWRGCWRRNRGCWSPSRWPTAWRASLGR